MTPEVKRLRRKQYNVPGAFRENVFVKDEHIICPLMEMKPRDFFELFYRGKEKNGWKTVLGIPYCFVRDYNKIKLFPAAHRKMEIYSEDYYDPRT